MKEKEKKEAYAIMAAEDKLRKALMGVISELKDPASHYTAVLMLAYDYLATFADVVHKPTGEIIKEFSRRLIEIREYDEEGLIRDNSNNRITKERDVVSSPMSKERCLHLMQEKKKKQHSHSVYSRMRMILYVEEPKLW